MYRHKQKNTWGCTTQNTSRCSYTLQFNETREVYKLVTKRQHIWVQDRETCSGPPVSTSYIDVLLNV